METYTLDKVSATLIHDTRQIKKNDLYPVKYRVTFMRKQVYFPSGIDLSMPDWQRLPTAKGKELKLQRELIQAGFEKIKMHIKELCKSDQGFCLEQLNTRLSRGMKNSIITAFYNKVETLKKDGRLGTSDCYLYSAKSLQRFTGGDELAF
jgi:integrase/recombinase XerD